MSYSAVIGNTKICSKLGILTRPDGSAVLCQGETTMLAGVYGPAEVKAQKILIDKATVEAHYRPKAGLPGVKDKLNELIVRNICETALVAAMYPRSAVVVIVQEMQNFGDLLSCAVNAAVLALLDTGIDLKFLVGAVSCCLDSSSTFHLNSNKCENAVANFVFVFESIDKCVVASYTKGSFTEEQYKEALKLCREHSVNIFNFLKESVMNVEE